MLTRAVSSLHVVSRVLPLSVHTDVSESALAVHFYCLIIANDINSNASTISAVVHSIYLRSSHINILLFVILITPLVAC